MFDVYPSYYRYRALHLTELRMVGEDVYALQLGLNAVGEFKTQLTPDGALGTKTSKAISGVQRKLKAQGFEVGPADGVAGQKTQRGIGEALCAEYDDQFPTGLPSGQIAHESSFLLGNYSPYRPATDSYDAGLCQRNTEHTEPKIAFDPVKSVAALVDRVLNHYEYFEGLPQRRRWELAAGSWNAPAYACYYARKEGAPVDASDTATPSSSGAAAFNAYVASVTAYLKL